MAYASVIVPAYNAEATLSQTLVSLSSQIYRDLEIIVVNDGSTDATAQIAEAHARRDGRIRVVSQFNRGLAGARNSGIAQASGEVVGFCDADDLWMPEKLSQHVSHLLFRPEIGLSFAGSALIDVHGARTGHQQRPRLRDVGAAHMFKRNPVGNGSAPVFRRAALQALTWRPKAETQRDWVFDESFRQSEDIECWLRLCLRTDWSVEGVPGLLTEYRVHGQGLSANIPAQLASWERMVVKLRPLAPEFFDAHEAAARAYQLRYLARRAVNCGDAEGARRLLRQSCAASLRPLLEEPLKTSVTWAAVLASARFGEGPMRVARSALRVIRS